MKFLMPLAAAGMVVFAASAGATTLSLTSAGTTCSIEDLTTSTACEGAYSGNDSNSIEELTVLFSETGWRELVKVDDDRGTNGALSVGVTLENDDGDGIAGTWSYTGDTSTFDGMIAVLKGGPSFSAYLLDLAVNPLAGNWNTDGILTGSLKSGPGLSHFTLWVRDGDGGGGGGGGGGPVVPLPAAGWMLLAGVGGLAAWGRRRRNAA